ncbi:MAG: SMC family ATPase [Thermoplasmata archaeon]|nr:MAG: SMC family ATPase [Thermoplasmata archaeon]
MILKTLTLKNFRKFKDITIEFPDGVTGIVGLNGVGKSTIFEAIAWVLYGPVAARTPSDQIKRQGAMPTEPCRVELEFVFEGDNYRIVREMTGKNLAASATATVNGKISATGAETVSRFIQKKLGMDFKSFFTSIFAKQKELNTLSSMVASERRPLILRMLGIDSLDLVIKEIRSDKKNKDTLIEKLRDDLVDESGRKKDEIFKEEIKNLDEKKEEINIVIKQLKKEIQSYKKELTSLEKKYIDDKNKYEKLKKYEKELVERKTLFEKKKRLLDEINALKKKIIDREKILTVEEKKLDVFKDIEKDLDSTEKRLDEINHAIEKFLKTIEQKKTLIQRILRDISDLDVKRRNIEKLGPDARCPTCERILGTQYGSLLKKFDNEKKGKQEEMKSLENEIKKVEDEKERLSREHVALQKKRNYLQNQFRERERITAKINHVLSEVKREKSELEYKKKEYDIIGDVVFNAEEFENVKKQVEKCYEKYQGSLAFFNKKKDKLMDITIKLEKVEGEKRLIDQEIKNLKRRIAELNHVKKQLKEEEKSAHYLGMLSEIMSNFRTHLISRVRPMLSSYSSEFFRSLTDGKYSEVELDENYDLLIYDNGEKYDVKRFSGGEEDLVNLCLRLAISEVITERAGGAFNFIILDEIFGSQDVFRRQNIMKALNNLSSKFRQIFLITHIEDVKNYMENVIYVTEDEEGNSSVKIE